MQNIRLLAVTSMLVGGAALASSPASWRTLDRQTATACIAKSGLRQARVGPAMRFSDTMMIDARIVHGTYRQRHMKAAKATMLCLYNRTSKRVEVTELQ